jgi:hypothetical protein
MFLTNEGNYYFKIPRDKGQADVAKHCSDYDFRKVGSKDKNSRTYAALAGYI